MRNEERGRTEAGIDLCLLWLKILLLKDLGDDNCIMGSKNYGLF